MLPGSTHRLTYMLQSTEGHTQQGQTRTKPPLCDRAQSETNWAGDSRSTWMGSSLGE